MREPGLPDANADEANDASSLDKRRSDSEDNVRGWLKSVGQPPRKRRRSL
jgi:hypothetical protein